MDFENCEIWDEKDRDMQKRIIIPNKAWLGFKSRKLPDMDKFFKGDLSGRQIDIQLVFRLNILRVIGVPVEVTKGSITFITRKGYMKFISGNRVAIKYEKSKPEKIFEYYSGGTFFSISCTKTFNRVDVVCRIPSVIGYEGASYVVQGLEADKEGNCGIVPLKVVFSDDFGESLIGWVVCAGK